MDARPACQIVRFKVGVALGHLDGPVPPTVALHDDVDVFAVEIPQRRSFLFGAVAGMLLRKEPVAQYAHPAGR